MKSFCCFICICLSFSLYSQDRVFAPERPEVVDGITKKKVLQERTLLSYPAVQERDILWERRIWREIDTRQKMNLPFRYAKAPLVKILIDEIRSGNLTAYSPEDDQFKQALCWSDLKQTLFRTDTISIVDPETYDVFYETVMNDLNPEDIHKFRIKEVWWIDSKYSALRVRILGIAPIKAVYDEEGKYRYDQPLFWIHYPHAREVLAKHAVFHGANDKLALSWEDWFEIRFFDGSVSKVSNVHDRPLNAYLSEKDRLIEAALIDQEIFNYEHDLWSH